MISHHHNLIINPGHYTKTEDRTLKAGTLISCRQTKTNSFWESS